METRRTDHHILMTFYMYLYNTLHTWNDEYSPLLLGPIRGEDKAANSVCDVSAQLMQEKENIISPKIRWQVCYKPPGKHGNVSFVVDMMPGWFGEGRNV